jgi:hypothetical protein
MKSVSYFLESVNLELEVKDLVLETELLCSSLQTHLEDFALQIQQPAVLL